MVLILENSFLSFLTRQGACYNMQWRHGSRLWGSSSSLQAQPLRTLRQRWWPLPEYGLKLCPTEEFFICLTSLYFKNLPYNLLLQNYLVEVLIEFDSCRVVENHTDLVLQQSESSTSIQSSFSSKPLKVLQESKSSIQSSFSSELFKSTPMPRIPGIV